MKTDPERYEVNHFSEHITKLIDIDKRIAKYTLDFFRNSAVPVDEDGNSILLTGGDWLSVDDGPFSTSKEDEYTGSRREEWFTNKPDQ